MKRSFPDDKKSADGAKRTLPKSARERIGRQLRTYYEDLANEPLPSKFQELLDSLEAAENQQENSNGQSIDTNELRRGPRKADEANDG